MIRFTSPLLLGVALAALVIVVLRLRHLPLDLAGARRRAVQLLMLLSTCSVGLALAGPEITARLDRVAVVFVLDQSRSVEHSDRSDAVKIMSKVRDSTSAMSADDQAGLVVFGAEAATVTAVSREPTLGVARANIPRDQTDIASGIRRALAELPSGYSGRLVVISDGVETRGDAIAAAGQASARGVTIDVYPMKRTPSPEIGIDRVHLPAVSTPGSPITLRLVTRATKESAARVRVRRNGQPLAFSETTIASGQDVLTLTDAPREPGVYRYEVSIDPVDAAADTARENNSGAALVRVSGAQTVLVCAGRPENARPLAKAIETAGLEPRVVGPSEIPPDLATLAQHDLIVLSDINARYLSEEQLEGLAAYVVHVGGGLLMVGARNSFGLGGYTFTPVEEVLPATFEIKRQRDRASLAMLIAIDRSGSMSAPVSGGRNKLDLANEAAARSAKLLSPLDRVGVIHIDTEVSWTVPMTAVEQPDAIAARIYRTQPGGGGILVDLTLTAAYGSLRRESTQLRHLLLFSDGADSENLDGTRAMVRAAANAGITTSVISMGRGQDTRELEVLSRLGLGRFFIVDDVRELPQIFTQETIEASRSAMVEEPFRPAVVEYDDVVRGLDFSDSPPLLGYVIVNPRPRTSVLLAASDEDPLLLTWQHGLGRSAVFATDAGSNFGRPWLSWPGYATLFGQLARDLARAPSRSDMSVQMTVRQGVGRIRVEAIDERGTYRNYLDLSASIVTPTGSSVEVPLVQTSSALYEGTFDASVPGPYLAGVREAELGTVGTSTIIAPVGDELRGEGTDLETLTQLATLTGGRVRDDLSQVFTDRPPTTLAATPLWRWCIGAALIMLLASVALRRLYLPADFLRRLIPAPIRQLFDRRKSKPQEQAKAIEATLEALSASRKHARKEKAERSIAQGRPRPNVPSHHKQTKTTSVERPEPTHEDKSASSLAEKLLERKRRRDSEEK